MQNIVMQAVKTINDLLLLWQSYFFSCFDQNIINIKYQMNSMSYTVLESYVYDNVYKVFLYNHQFFTYVFTHVQWFVEPWFSCKVNLLILKFKYNYQALRLTLSRTMIET